MVISNSSNKFLYFAHRSRFETITYSQDTIRNYIRIVVNIVFLNADDVDENGREKMNNIRTSILKCIRIRQFSFFVTFSKSFAHFVLRLCLSMTTESVP